MKAEITALIQKIDALLLEWRVQSTVDVLESEEFDAVLFAKAEQRKQDADAIERLLVDLARVEEPTPKRAGCPCCSRPNRPHAMVLWTGYECTACGRHYQPNDPELVKVADPVPPLSVPQNEEFDADHQNVRPLLAGDRTQAEALPTLQSLAEELSLWVRRSRGPNYEEPIDEAGKRILRCAIEEINRRAVPAIGAEPPAPVVHELKTWPLYFQAVVRGEKTFEIRRNDRDFTVGDVVRLREFGLHVSDPDGRYTGAICERRIVYKTGFEQKPGYVVLGLAALRSGGVALPPPNLEICICAAWRAIDHTIWRGHRHNHCRDAMVAAGRQPSVTSQAQGFITSRNRFVDRREAARLQKEAQIPTVDESRVPFPSALFSEDLY